MSMDQIKTLAGEGIFIRWSSCQVKLGKCVLLVLYFYSSEVDEYVLLLFSVSQSPGMLNAVREQG